MMILAAYDITDDNRRAHLAALLQAVGNRVQKSVFVLTLDAAGLSEPRQKATSIIDTDRDSLFLFRQCAGCWEALDYVGQAEPPSDVPYWEVL